MISRQINELPGLVLLHRLELLLHRRLPSWIALRLSIGGWLAGVRQVQLGEESRHRPWWSPVADDVGHRAIAKRFVVVERVQTVLIALQRRGVLDQRLIDERRRGSGKAGDAVADGAVGEAGWSRGEVATVAVAFPSSPGAGEGERSGAMDVDGDAPCAPLAPPLQRYSTVNSSTANAELSPTLVQSQPRPSSKTTSCITRTR